MEQLIYQSRAGHDFGHGDIFDIIRTSARRNLDRGITGFLLFKNDQFLQLVEGPSAGLDALLADLSCDPRHREMKILSRKRINGRRFDHWVMKRVVAELPAKDLRLVKQALEEIDGSADLFGKFFDGGVCENAGLVRQSVR